MPLAVEGKAASDAAPSGPPSPAPETESHEPSQDDESKPRRTGWWSKRVLGG